MEKAWINPFGSDQTEFISLSTGAAVPAAVVADDLIRVTEIGERVCERFQDERIASRKNLL